MKHRHAPNCPRCNSSDDVKKIAYGLTPSNKHPGMTEDGYVLGGLCIRPDSPEWYCAICAESFGASRESWGEPVTDVIQ